MVRYVSEERRVGVRSGSWTPQEDALLINCIQKYGEGKWRQVPLRAGLNRCRKSCRLRWLNYLHPSIKRGEFAPDEVDLIIKLHKLLGNRWSLIAGRIPGRTANDIKNYWNSNLSKKLAHQRDANSGSCSKVIKPKPLMFQSSSKGVRPTFHYCGELQTQPQQQSLPLQQQQVLKTLSSPRDGDFDCWKSLSFEEGEERGTSQAEGFGGMGSGSSEPLGSMGGEDEWDGLFKDPDLWRLLEVDGEHQSTCDI